MEPAKSFKDLVVWKKAHNLVLGIYKLTSLFPKAEIYGLTSQMRRAAVSIPANIAEERYRGSKKDFTQFIRIAYSSGAELETHVEIAKRLPFGKTLSYTTVDSLLIEVMKMLNVMIRKLTS